MQCGSLPFPLKYRFSRKSFLINCWLSRNHRYVSHTAATQIVQEIFFSREWEREKGFQLMQVCARGVADTHIHERRGRTRERVRKSRIAFERYCSSCIASERCAVKRGLAHLALSRTFTSVFKGIVFFCWKLYSAMWNVTFAFTEMLLAYFRKIAAFNSCYSRAFDVP